MWLLLLLEILVNMYINQAVTLQTLKLTFPHKKNNCCLTLFKIGALIHSIKFLSPEIALYLYKSTIQPPMECCCHVWAGAPSCYLEVLDKFQKQICRTIGSSPTASLEPLAHCQNVVSLSFFCRYYFGRCSSELAELVPLPYSRGRSICYWTC